MSLPTFTSYYMAIANVVKSRANCKGSRVGAVIVKDNRVISTGYNGTPHGMTNCLDGGCQRCANRETIGHGKGYDSCICVHAEQNALLSAARFGISVDGGTLYTTMQPCFGCLKELIQANISQVYYDTPWTPSKEYIEEYNLLANRISMIQYCKIPDINQLSYA